MAESDFQAAARPASARNQLTTLDIVCVFLVFLLAMFLRVEGISRLPPLMIDADEPDFVVPALRMLANGDLNPGWFGHPGSLTMYGLSFIYRLDAMLDGASLNSILERYKQDPTPFYILGKQFIVFWAMLGHLAFWLLARQLMPKWPALLALLLLACAPLDIEYATLIRTDTQQSCLVLVFCCALLSLVRTGRWRAYIASGALLGLATSVKWPSAVLCLAIVLASFLTPERKGSWRPSRKQVLQVTAAAAASALALFLAAPYAFLDFGTTLKNVGGEARTYSLNAANPSLLSGMGFYLRLLASDLSLPMALLAAVGAVLSVRTKQWREAVVLLFIFASYLVFISAQGLRWARWGVPLLPLTCVGAALGAQHLVELARTRWTRPALSIGLSILLGAGSVAAASANVLTVLDKRRDQPGPQATDWIVRHLPPGAKILAERQTPYLPRKMYEIYEVDAARGGLYRARQTSKYHMAKGLIMYLSEPSEALAKVDYILLSNYHSKITRDPARYHRGIEVYETLLKGSKRLQKFGPYEVFKVKKPKKKKKRNQKH